MEIKSSNAKVMGWDEGHAELTENLSRSYSKSVQIDFDPAKDRANRDKHGVSLVLAVELDWEAALVRVDDRFEYNETRMIALAPKTGPVLRGVC